MNPNKTIDCTGLYCPEPIFRTRMALDELESGQALKVIADDPAAEEDITRWAKRTGNTVLAFEQCDDYIRFLIQKTNG